MTEPKQWRPGARPPLAALILVLALASNAKALWTGRFDLSPAVSPIMIRELHDGQWLAGVTKENIWHLDHNDKQLIHAGIFQAWNTERGNASFGPVIGLDLPIGLGPVIANMAAAIGLGEFFKPLQYVGSALSLDAIGGYRPIHTSDVDGSWVYGAGLRMNIAFGVKELQKGL